MNTRILGRLGFGWAASYLPVHLYWALGGESSDIGITSSAEIRSANWGASLVILGAGLTCLALTSPWGRALPRALRAGAAWIGGVFALAHWAVFTAGSTLRLTGLMAYPTDADATPAQLRHFDWWNLGYFELWFGLMGAILVACAWRTRRREPAVAGSRWRRVGTTLMLAGIATVILGVFTFNAWVFALAGPAVMAVGLITLLTAHAEPWLDLRDRDRDRDLDLDPRDAERSTS